MNRLRPLLLLLPLLSPLVFACATSKTRPPTNALALGRYRARWINPDAQDLCRRDPRQLAEELEDANSLLTTFLKETSAGWRAVWSAESMALLQEGQQRLPRALETLEQTHRRLAPCPFDRAWDFEALITQGRKLAQLTRLRLEQAPSLLNSARRREELEAWKKEQAEQRQANLEQWCKDAKATKPYYAAEDEEGLRVFVFCDGTEVTLRPGNEPKLTAAAVGKGRKERAYFEEVERFPEEELLRAPKLPKPPADE